jgi:hypothetical protein
VVDGVGRVAAVLTRVLVANEHRTTRHSGAAVIWNLDDISETNHDRIRNAERLGVEVGAIVFDDVGLVGQYETSGTA